MVNLPEGTTQNLMDYSAGTELFKYQWDYVHNPEGGWFVGEDSEEGAAVSENFASQFLRIARSINCARTKNQHYASVYFGFNDQTVTIKKLDPNNTAIGNEKIRFFFSDESYINFTRGYGHTNLSVTPIYKDSQYTVVFKDDSGREKLFITPISSAQNKGAVYTFIKNLLENPLSATITGLSIEDAKALSTCELEQIGLDDRERLLTEITNLPIIHISDGKLAIELIKATPSNQLQSLFQHLNSSISLKLYTGIVKYRSELVASLYNLWAASQPDNSPVGVLNFEGVYGTSFDYRFTSTGRIEFTGEYTLPAMYWNPSGGSSPTRTLNMGDYKPFDKVLARFTGSFSTELDGQVMELPSLMVYHLMRLEDVQQGWDALNGAMHVAFIFVSAGQLNTAIAGITTTGNWAIKAFNVSLALAELSSIGITHACYNNTSEFCRWWKEYEIIVNLGLVTVQSLPHLKNVLSKIKQHRGQVELTTAQKTYLDEILDGVQGAGKLGTLIDDAVDIVAKNENLPNWIKKSFKNGEYVTVQTKQNITVYRDFGDKAFMDGSFSTTINNATRNELALHESFENSMRFKSTIEVPSNETLNIGKVGPYPPGSQNALPGGADQILLPENYNHNWIKEIRDTQTGQIYTVEEFKSAFPNLIKNL